MPLLAAPLPLHVPPLLTWHPGVNSKFTSLSLGMFALHFLAHCSLMLPFLSVLNVSIITCSTSSPAFVIVYIFIIAILVGVKYILAFHKYTLSSWGNSPLLLVFSIFLNERLDFVKCFSYTEMIVCFLFLLFYQYGALHWLSYVKPPLHSWDKSPLIMMYNSFNVLLDLVCWYFAEKFCVYIHREKLKQQFSCDICLALGTGQYWVHKKELGKVSSSSSVFRVYEESVLFHL